MSTAKQAYKIGEMIVDQKQIFWKMQYCYALIPIVQHLEGRNYVLTQTSSSPPIGQSSPTTTLSQSKFSIFLLPSISSPNPYRVSTGARPPTSISKTPHNNHPANR